MFIKKTTAGFLGAIAIAATTQAAILLPAPITTIVGPGTTVATALTVNPNDFPSPTPSNNLTTSVTLNTAASPLDAIYTGTNSLGTTEYAVTATVLNSTGLTLTGYEFELGTGTGGSFAPAISANIPSFYGLNPSPSSNVFSSNTLTADTLTFTSGSIAPNGMGIFTFNLAVPDTATGALPAFTMRELPTAIPEPTSLALLGVGGLLMARRRYRNA